MGIRGARDRRGSMSEKQKAECLELMDVVSQVRRTPSAVIQDAINCELVFGTLRNPSEVESKNDPPISLSDRSEHIEIDGALGH
jgi:hypothetical protein